MTHGVFFFFINMFSINLDKISDFFQFLLKCKKKKKKKNKKKKKEKKRKKKKKNKALEHAKYK